MSFTALGLNDSLLRAINDAGYTTPSPIQAAAIPQILQGSDLIGIAQTGTGKTAAFTLPILHLLNAKPKAPGAKARVLVIAPTRELVAQIEENIIAYAKHLPQLKIGKVYGGVGETPQIKMLRSGADIVIACPGRLLDLMNRGFTDFSQLTHLVLDEADRMLDMGFVHDIRRVVAKLPRKRQTLLFSATFSREIQDLTAEFQHSPKVVEIGKRSDPAKTVEQAIYEVPKHLKQALLQHLLGDEALKMVIVFSRTKHGADRIAKKLQADGISTATIHANRSQNQRIKALDDFKAGRVRVLVATDIAARGIDVDGISHVVNYDFPNVVDDYVHRIGRTGRAEATGDAISFVDSEEIGDLRAVERRINKALPRLRAEGFDYGAAAPPRSADSERDRERGPRQPRHQQQRQRQPQQGQRPARGGDTPRPAQRTDARPAQKPRPARRPDAPRPVAGTEEQKKRWWQW